MSELDIKAYPHARHPDLIHVVITYLPTGDRTFSIKRTREEAESEAFEKLAVLVSRERARSETITTDREALLDTLSWSNTDCAWGDSYTTSDEVVDGILRGLKHRGWKVVKA